jgi:hypothetical protein
MTAAEFNAALRTLGLSEEQFAATHHLPLSAVRAWAGGLARIPRRMADQLAWDAAMTTREHLLRQSGLATCDWWEHNSTTSLPDDLDEAERFAEEVEQHVRDCALCEARTAYLEQHAPPMPERVLPVWLRVFEAIGRLPRWLQPAAIGAAVVAALVLLRGVLLLPSIDSAREGGLFVLGLVAALVVAGSGGAVGGLAFAAIRRPLRRLGQFGDYLSAIAGFGGYVAVVVLLLQLAGEPMITKFSDFVVLAVMVVFFGLVAGVGWVHGGRISRWFFWRS